MIRYQRDSARELGVSFATIDRIEIRRHGANYLSKRD